MRRGRIYRTLAPSPRPASGRPPSLRAPARTFRRLRPRFISFNLVACPSLRACGTPFATSCGAGVANTRAGATWRSLGSTRSASRLMSAAVGASATWCASRPERTPCCTPRARAPTSHAARRASTCGQRSVCSMSQGRQPASLPAGRLRLRGPAGSAGEEADAESLESEAVAPEPARPVRTPAPPAARPPPRPAQGRSWRTWLGRVATRSFAVGVDAPAPPLLYLIDPDEIARRGELRLSFAERPTPRDGSLGVLRRSVLDMDAVAPVVDHEEASARGRLRALAQVDPRRTYGGWGPRPWWVTIPDAFVDSLLPQLAATGRLGALPGGVAQGRGDDASPEPRWLAFDPGPPWQLRLALARGGGLRALRLLRARRRDARPRRARLRALWRSAGARRHARSRAAGRRLRAARRAAARAGAHSRPRARRRAGRARLRARPAPARSRAGPAVARGSGDARTPASLRGRRTRRSHVPGSARFRLRRRVGGRLRSGATGGRPRREATRAARPRGGACGARRARGSRPAPPRRADGRPALRGREP